MPTFQCLLFVSCVNIKKPCVHCVNNCSVGCFSQPRPHFWLYGAWTWLCAWLPAVAALFGLQLIPQPSSPLSSLPEDASTGLCAEQTAP